MPRRDRTRPFLSAILGLALATTGVAEKPAPAAHVSAWPPVAATPGHLAYVRALTDFALHAHVATFPDALASARALPEERARRAELVLAHAFVARDTDAALRWHSALGADASHALREGFFTALALREPDRAWREAEQLADDEARRAALGFVASTHARAAPLDALARAEQLAGPLRREILPRALDAWIRQTPDAAFAWTAKNLPEDRRRAALLVVLPWLGGRDFDALLRLEAAPATDPVLRDVATETIDRHISTQPVDTIWRRLLSSRGKAVEFSNNGILGPSLYDMLEYAAARPSSEVAAAFARLAPEFDRHPREVASILSVWILHAPEAALAWAEARPAPDHRDAALLAAQPVLLETRPDLAFARYDTAVSGPFREELAACTAQALSQIDISRTLDWTLALSSGEDRAAALNRLFDTAIYDTTLLAAATPRLASAPAGQIVAVDFANQWIARDPAAASAWFDTLPAGSLRDQVQESLLTHISLDTPEAAIARANKLPDGPERALLIEKLVEHQTAAHPAEIFALIDTLPDGSGRRHARNAALSKLGSHDPQTAAALLDSGALGETSPSSIRALAIAWSRESPASAANWLTRHVASSGNHADIVFGGVSTVARRYGENSPDQALAWARSLPDPKAARVASIEVAEAMASRFPDRAWREVLAHYPDERALSPIFGVLASRAPDRARRLLADSDLPAELRSKLASTLSSP